MRYKVEAVFACEDQITLEESFADRWNVRAITSHEFLCKAKVDHLYLMKIIFVSSEGGRQADEDIVQLDIVKCIAGFMDDLDLLEELKTNLVGASWGEGLIAREEMRLQGFTKLFLDKIGPDLIVKGFHHIVLGKVREVFDVTELSVEDEHFAFAVSLNKLNTDCLGPLAYVSSSIKLSISHGMIF